MLDKVHGLQATSITLHERFTLLASAAVDRVINRPRQRRRSTGGNGNYFNQNNTFRSQNLLQQIAWQLERQAKIQALRQRIGNRQGNLRRYGSEGNLNGLRRSNSFGNLNQNNIRNRVGWQQSNGNLSRAGSFNNIANAVWRGQGLRGYKRRGGSARALRGRFRGNTRGGRQYVGKVTRVGQGPPRKNFGPRARGGNNLRGRGRGVKRQQQQLNKPVPSKEELDNQLDEYMACTKTSLDKELEEYMKNAMEME